MRENDDESNNVCEKGSTNITDGEEVMIAVDMEGTVTLV